MRRFFLAKKSLAGDTALLSEAESHHIASVLRLQPGDPVELFDGSGTVYDGTLRSVSPDRVTVQVLSRQNNSTISLHPLYLYQSLLKGKKMDFLVQKATELEVYSFQPVVTRYSINRSNQQRQHDRWQRIMIEACKQCKRSVPMEIHPVVPLDQVDVTHFATKLLLWEGEDQVRIDANLFQEPGPVCLLLGPEGGIHPEELAWARANGFASVSLGNLTLRAETATIAAITIVQFLLDSTSERT